MSDQNAYAVKKIEARRAESIAMVKADPAKYVAFRDNAQTQLTVIRSREVDLAAKTQRQTQERVSTR